MILSCVMIFVISSNSCLLFCRWSDYADFKRVFRRSRSAKDDHRALNLLRGFFFYFEVQFFFVHGCHETLVRLVCTMDYCSYMICFFCRT